MSILNAITHLITLLLYSGRQFMHCMILPCVQYNVKSCCLFLSRFAKDANVANNKQRLANFMTQSKIQQECYKCYENGNYVKSATRKAGVRGFRNTPLCIYAYLSVILQLLNHLAYYNNQANFRYYLFINFSNIPHFTVDYIFNNRFHDSVRCGNHRALFNPQPTFLSC